MAENLYFVSSLPRSGSTLMMNLLGQNPNHYVTPTSGLIELFCNINTSWKNVMEFKSEGIENIKHRVEGAMQGILLGYFQNEMLKGKSCFDKSRGWLQYIEEIEIVLNRKVQVISTVRDVRSILASFEKIYRKRGIDYPYPVPPEFFKAQTVEGRCELLLSEKGVLGIAINRLRDALRRIGDRVIVIPYDYLTSDPQGVMKILHDKLDLKDFEYDHTNVKQVTKENDLWHGMDLHVIKPEIKPQENQEPWKGILTDEYASHIEKTYADINQMAKI